MADFIANPRQQRHPVHALNANQTMKPKPIVISPSDRQMWKQPDRYYTGTAIGLNCQMVNICAVRSL